MLAVRNPATEKTIAELDEAGREEADAAVAAARAAFPAWRAIGAVDKYCGETINSNTTVRVATPFGGFKQSGFGRELGMHALEGYSEVKNVYVATD